jgi:hypothetical protein
MTTTTSPSTDFVSDFAFFKLAATLKELNCGSLESRLIDWYWRASRTWEDCDSQEEFEAAAKRRLAAKYRFLIDPHKDTLATIERGAKHTIPTTLRSNKFLGYDRLGREKFSTTGMMDDAQQDAWVELLKNEVFASGQFRTNPRPVGIAAMSAGRDRLRTTAKEVPTDFNVVKKGDDGEILAIEPSHEDSVFAQDDPTWKLLRGWEDETRVKIIQQFADERPDDFRFLMQHISNKRKFHQDRADVNRARAITSRLRRLEALESWG